MAKKWGVDHQLRAHRRRLVSAASALTAVVLFGTIGFMLIQDDWDFWKSLYFTLITITTVGYGDYGLSPAGERFTSLLLVFGIATATYAFSQLVQAIIFLQLNWRRKMQKQIDALRNQFVVCGLGRVGRAIATNLASQGHPFVIVDPDENVCDWARMQGYPTVQGSATEDQTLHEAGIERASGLVCVSNDDSENIVMTLTARDLNPTLNIVSRAGHQDSIHKLRRAGATRVVAPELSGGNDITSMLTKPHLADFLEKSRGADSEYALSEITILPDSELLDRTIRDYGVSEPSIIFVAIKREEHGTRLRPTADERIQAGDVFIVAGDTESIARMTAQAQPKLAEAVTV